MRLGVQKIFLFIYNPIIQRTRISYEIIPSGRNGTLPKTVFPFFIEVLELRNWNIVHMVVYIFYYSKIVLFEVFFLFRELENIEGTRQVNKVVQDVQE